MFAIHSNSYYALGIIIVAEIQHYGSPSTSVPIS